MAVVLWAEVAKIGIYGCWDVCDERSAHGLAMSIEDFITGSISVHTAPIPIPFIPLAPCIYTTHGHSHIEIELI